MHHGGGKHSGSHSVSGQVSSQVFPHVGTPQVLGQVSGHVLAHVFTYWHVYQHVSPQVHWSHVPDTELGSGIHSGSVSGAMGLTEQNPETSMFTVYPLPVA